jgi:oligopeptide transport system substrate-binding protein
MGKVLQTTRTWFGSGRVRVAIVALAATFLAVPLAASAQSGPLKTLHRGNQAEPTSLDHHKASDIQSFRIASDMFEGLLATGPDGTPILGAAESWRISPDGLTYHFFLRADGRWSDGTPVTADDFVFAWRRLLDPATRSDYAYFLWPVKNGEAVNKGELPPDRLGVEAVDARTFKVTLERPTGYFFSSLLHRTTYPVSKANVEKFGDAFIKPGNLVSNGAYRLDAHVPQSYVRLTKNPHYRRAAAIKTDAVVFHHSDSPETELRRFRAGELDIVQMAPVTQVDWLRENMPEVIWFYNLLGTDYIAINLTREPWKSNKKARQALALAIDRQLLVEKITKGGETPAYSFVAPGIAGYQPATMALAAAAQADRDAAARKLIAEAGYGPGGKPLEVEILHNTSESVRKVAVGIASMWQAKLNAKVTLNNQEWKVVLQKAGEKDYAGTTMLSWLGDFRDPYTFLKLNAGSIGKMNRTGYDNPAYDALLVAAESEVDPAARMRKLQEAEAILMDDLPLIPLIARSNRNLVQTYVKGWNKNPLGIQLSQYIDIDAKKP